MILEAFQALLLSADPEATRYEGSRDGNYTVWRQYGSGPLSADNHRAEKAMKIQVDRFTKIEDDPIADAIMQTLDHQDHIAFDYLQDYEVDTGYIHHIWDCEVV